MSRWTRARDHAARTSDALRSHIYAIRRAVDRGHDVALLQTLRGVGYRLAPVEEDA